MSQKEECPRCIQKIAGWMATFSDMSTLLLTFFILLLTMIEEGVPTEDLNTVVNAFRGGRGLSGGGTTLSKGKMEDMGMTVQSLPSQSKGKNMGKMKNLAQILLKQELKARKVEVVSTKSGFAVELVGSLYYAPGAAELNEEGKEVLLKIKDLILKFKSMSIDNAVKVKGFADGGLIASSSKLYAHNLQLTTTRANNVIYYFIKQGIDPRRMYKGRNFAKFQSIGYGEFQPTEANVSPEQRAYNRKVSIEFLQDPDAV